MSGGGKIRFGSVVWVSIPGTVPHPAVVVYVLGDGGYVVVGGTGAPQGVEPTLMLDVNSARQCGLTKPTGFYTCASHLWVWRPKGAPHPIGGMFFKAALKLRAAADRTMRTMKSLVDMQRLPPDAAFTAEQIAKLRESIRDKAEAAAPEDPPSECPEGSQEAVPLLSN